MPKIAHISVETHHSAEVATAYFNYNHVTASPNVPAIRWANFYGAPPTVEYGEVKTTKKNHDPTTENTTLGGEERHE